MCGAAPLPELQRRHLLGPSGTSHPAPALFPTPPLRAAAVGLAARTSSRPLVRHRLLEPLLASLTSQRRSFAGVTQSNVDRAVDYLLETVFTAPFLRWELEGAAALLLTKMLCPLGRLIGRVAGPALGMAGWRVGAREVSRLPGEGGAPAADRVPSGCPPCCLSAHFPDDEDKYI